MSVEHDVVFMHRTVGWRLVPHVEHLGTRSQICVWSPMTIQAELHLQGSKLIDQRHLVDRPVAGVAAHTLINVNAVIEVHEIRHLIDARPLQRFAAPEAFTHRFQQRRVGPDLRMAIHAGLGRRNAGETRLLDRSVTIAPVNTESGHVMLVAEGHRLRLSDPGIRYVGRALDLPQNPAQSPDDNRNYYQRSAGNGIAAAWKNLHLSRVFHSAGSVAPLPALHISYDCITLACDQVH